MEELIKCRKSKSQTICLFGLVGAADSEMDFEQILKCDLYSTLLGWQTYH